jgi:hypothetical protein
MSGRRGALRLAALVLIAVAVAVGNVVFDRGVVEGANRYLAEQRAHHRGERPFVYVRDVMRPAIADSARRAAAWSVPIAAFGLVCLWGRRYVGTSGT